MNCKQCGAQLGGFETNCPICGAPVSNNNQAAVQQPQVAQPMPAAPAATPGVAQPMPAAPVATPGVAQPMSAAPVATPEVQAGPAAPMPPQPQMVDPASMGMANPQAMGYGDMSAPQVTSLSEAQGETKPSKKLSGRTIVILIALVISIIIAVVYYGFIY